MNHLEQGTENIIKRWGNPITIETSYVTTASVSEGDNSITLTETWGIHPGAEFSLEEESIVVAKILSDTVIELKDPVANSYDAGVSIHNVSETKALPVPRFKRISYELFEFIRKFRVPKAVVVNYGSILSEYTEKFFIVGMDPGDASYAITLREINERLSIKRRVLDEEADNTWGSSSNRTTKLDTIASNITAYFQYGRAELPFRADVGYLKGGQYIAIIPQGIDIKIEDIVETPDDVYKVVGFDRYTNKNLLTLILDYDPPNLPPG